MYEAKYPEVDDVVMVQVCFSRASLRLELAVKLSGSGDGRGNCCVTARGALRVNTDG